MSRDPAAPLLLELLVEQGLSEYVTLIAPTEDIPVMDLLRRSAQQRAPELTALPWPERRAALAAAWQRADGPFPRLTEQIDLDSMNCSCSDSPAPPKAAT